MEKMKMKKVESQTVKDKRLGLILMIPIVLVIFIIMGGLLIRAIYWSFTDKVVGSDPNFIGLKNYIGLFQDKVYWKSLRNTAIYTGGCILAKLLLGLLWAGRERTPAIIAALMVLPVVWDSLSHGIQAMDPKLLELAR